MIRCRRLVLSLTCVLALLAGGCAEDASSAAPRKPTARNASERGATAAVSAPWPRTILRAEQIWQLNLPKGERFDASGLAFNSKGELLTLSDRGPSIYRIDFRPNTNTADLVTIPNCFTPAQLQGFTRDKIDRYDSEGIALDAQGKIYVCEEANRWVLRWDPSAGTVERLAIDWSPMKKYFDPLDWNASFEGIAVGEGRLFVANERQLGRIIVVNLANLQIVDDFSVQPSGSNARDIHYSDLCWFDGVLYALLRESRCVLAVNPKDHRVLAEYNFKEMEREPDLLYRSFYPTSQMEGLAVDRDFLWLVTDNNGIGRARHPNDIRPTLFKCRRQPIPKE